MFEDPDEEGHSTGKRAAPNYSAEQLAFHMLDQMNALFAAVRVQK